MTEGFGCPKTKEDSKAIREGKKRAEDIIGSRPRLLPYGKAQVSFVW